LPHLPTLRSKAWLSVAVLTALLGCGALFLACSSRRQEADSLPLGRLRVGQAYLSVEVAFTSASRARGLMFRPSLPADRGMLFVYREPALVSFWMKDTSIPLDIAFADGEGVIFQMETMTPYSLDSYLSQKPARYALEVNRGWFAAQGVRVGDHLVLDPLVNSY